MTARAQGPVFLIDDEAGVRQALASMLSTYDFAVQAFASADAFLAAHGGEGGGCLT